MSATAAAHPVLIVEPDDYRRRRHRLALAHAPDFTVAADAPGKRQALAYLSRHAVDFVVTNSMLPDGNAADIIRSARRRNPECLVLAVSDCQDANIVLHTIISGADGYVLFSDERADLASCLRVLQAGGSAVSPLVARTVLQSLQSRRSAESLGEADHPLSARELDILRLLAKGISFVQISQVLALSQSTVSTHAKNMYRKLDVHSRSQAVLRARQMRIL